MGEDARGGPDLLIVDDDSRIRELAEHVASRSGFFRSVTTAANGRDALQKLFGGDALPEVILTDLSMPEIDGFELVQTLKNLPMTRHIPVCMFSSSGVLYDQQHALDVGCAAFFPKPVTVPGLLDVLKSVAETATKTAAEPAS